MFDFSFGEMLIVALVALVVLGPERLPKAARMAGAFVRRARNQWESVKAERPYRANIVLMTKRMLAGRSARRRMYQAHQASP